MINKVFFVKRQPSFQKRHIKSHFIKSIYNFKYYFRQKYKNYPNLQEKLIHNLKKVLSIYIKTKLSVLQIFLFDSSVCMLRLCFLNNSFLLIHMPFDITCLENTFSSSRRRNRARYLFIKAFSNFRLKKSFLISQFIHIANQFSSQECE